MDDENSMKRALKTNLFSAGAMAGILGLFFWDTISRAERAIEENESRLADEIAALRSRRSAPQDAVFRLEDGHTGTLDPKGRSSVQEVFRCRFAPPPDNILAELTALRRRLREGGYALQYYRCEKERIGLLELRLLLEKRPPPESELQKIREAVEQLDSTRPTAAECVTEEHLLDRAEVLRVLRRKEDPYVMIARPPGWRELFSWRVLIAKALRQLDDHHREIQDAVERNDLPPFDANLFHREEATVLSNTRLRYNAPYFVDLDRQLVREWEQARRAVGSK